MSNSEKYKTEAINLKSYPLKESDKIVVMYSRDKGLMRAVAKGTKKTKSSLGARMETFFANTLLLSKGRNMDVVSQAETVNSFSESRKRLDKIGFSMYLAEVVNCFGVENDPSSKEIYDLLYESLDTISNVDTKKDILIAVLKFQLKMMLLSGFLPEFSTCLKCGKKIENDGYFSLLSGGVVCKDCLGDTRGKLIIHPKIRDFLNYLTVASFSVSGEYENKATEKVCEVCFNMLKDCIEQHSAKKIKTSEFLMSV